VVQAGGFGPPVVAAKKVAQGEARIFVSTDGNRPRRMSETRWGFRDCLRDLVHPRCVRDVVDWPKHLRGALVAQRKESGAFMLETGKPFPNFSLPNQDGKQMKLGDFAGKWLVVYVYPKDDTPGCTIQGKSFTASKADFDAAGIKVVGVSADDVASHKNFCNKFAFTIDLLADTNAELLKAAGVGQTDYNGTKYWNRTSFVIDPKGNLRKVYEKVNPQGHEKVLLDDIKAMQKQG
jgi:peroxiredoxin Q/BCP